MKLVIALVIFIPLALRVARNEALEIRVRENLSGLRLLFRTGCFIVIATTLSLGLASAIRDQVNHDQSTILSIAEAVRHGQTMYPGPQAPVEYGLLYGPATYILYIPALSLVSTRLTPALLTASATSGLAFLVVLLSLRRRFGWTMALAGTALMVAFVAPIFTFEWQARADPWILLSVALGLPAARLGNRWVAAVSLAILGALLADLKFPLIIVGLLPCAELWRRRGGQIPAVIAVVLMPLLALTPFLTKEISLRGYVEQLAEASHHGFSGRLLAENLLFTLYLVLPSIFLMWGLWHRNPTFFRSWLRQRGVTLALLLAVLGIAELTGTKHGAGDWHLAVLCAPLAVLDTEMFVELWKADRQDSVSLLRSFAVPAAFTIVLVGNIAIGWSRGWHSRTQGLAGTISVSVPDVERDLVAVLRRDATKQWVMGYTDNWNYSLTSVRPLLQVYGLPLVLDGVSRNEADMAHRPVSDQLSATVASCRYPDWILPRWGQPFSMESGYFLDGSIHTPELYPVEFQRIFLAHYRPVESSKYFTLWHCGAH